MATGDTPTQYTGQVERDPDPGGWLWAVPHRGGRVVYAEPVRSLRRGRRRVTDLPLAATDASLARHPSHRRSLLRRVDTDGGQPPDAYTPVGHRPPRHRGRRGLR